LIAAGQSIGSYRILQMIGTGGMGAVYLAEHPLIGKKVALKVIHKDLATNKEIVQRFFQEAKAVTKIGNEHIVSIHDFGQTPEGDHFYIMEYLEGHTLASVLSQDRVLPVMRAMHIGAQIAAALAAAHASGVIHRDLKPDNIMLTPRLGDPDFVVLLDFGLAKIFAADSASMIKTAAGVLLGTPQYMSPEACESRPNLDHRTDIYAVGILLFQMVTGMLPFDGGTMGEVLVKQVTQLPPPPRGFNPNIPPSVEQIILRCLAKNPEVRFPTMQALREALLDPEAYLMASPPVTPARSLAPGEAKVDAKTVMAYAAAQQADNAGSRSNAALQLPPVAHVASAQAKTMIADGPGAPPQQAAQAQAPDMIAPTMPKMNTMRIATPPGYSSRPPRTMWPVVLVVAVLLGVGGGAFAVVWFKRHNASDAAAAAVGPADAAAHVTVMTVMPDAAPAVAIDAASARPALAAVVIDSSPSGAEVLGPDKQSVGVTPVKLQLPISDMPLEYELHLAGYRTRTTQVIVTGNTMVQVSLERMPPPAPSQPAPKKKKRPCTNCLERPD
jgi:serine/threonine-protein kinase